MKYLRPILSMGFFCLLLLALAILGVAPASSQGVEITPDAPQPTDVFQVTVTPTISPTISTELSDYHPHFLPLIPHQVSRLRSKCQKRQAALPGSFLWWQ